MIAPPSPGPIARLMLTPTLSADSAAGSSAAGTSCGTIACQAGAVMADPAPTRNANSNRLSGVTRCSQTITANPVAKATLTASPAIRNLRRSTISTSAPAGTASRKIGRLVATCTIDTSSGEESRFVISQLEAALYIQ